MELFLWEFTCFLTVISVARRKSCETKSSTYSPKAWISLIFVKLPIKRAGRQFNGGLSYMSSTLHLQGWKNRWGSSRMPLCRSEKKTNFNLDSNRGRPSLVSHSRFHDPKALRWRRRRVQFNGRCVRVGWRGSISLSPDRRTFRSTAGEAHLGGWADGSNPSWKQRRAASHTWQQPGMPWHGKRVTRPNNWWITIINVKASFAFPLTERLLTSSLPWTER